MVEAIKLSLNNLGLDYLDLALIHWPLALKPGTGYLWPLDENNKTQDVNISVVETWKGMEDAHRLGLARSIGVSNFNSEQLTRVMKQAWMKPVVNQVSLNTCYIQGSWATHLVWGRPAPLANVLPNPWSCE